MKWTVRPGALSGKLTVPGDKSIAHRSLLLGALASGTSTVRGLPQGEDVRSTAQCVTALGVRLEEDGNTVSIHANGALREPQGDLDAGNSGTTMRLLCGILAGQPFASTLTGDASLRGRPMRRIIEPLEQMGARINAQDGMAPLRIRPAALRGITYALPIASAQVKSAILLAGLFAEGETAVIEPIPTRDHTERMLRGARVPVHRKGDTICLRAGPLAPQNITIPGDISSAAYFLAAGALTGEGITVRDVGVNPTRTGMLNVLERMGALAEISAERISGEEPLADVTIHGRADRPVRVEETEVPLLVDELPMIALLATQACGTSIIRAAGELRFKETDRIAAVANSLSRLGAIIHELPDGWVIEGSTPLRGAQVSSYGDHRLAMMLAIAGTIAGGTTEIEGADAANISYPDFDAAFAALGGRIERD